LATAVGDAMNDKLFATVAVASLMSRVRSSVAATVAPRRFLIIGEALCGSRMRVQVAITAAAFSGVPSENVIPGFSVIVQVLQSELGIRLSPRPGWTLLVVLLTENSRS
jgi:hypothetical protein